MPVTSITSVAPTATPNRQAKTELGKDDFLKLIAGQLKHQDPTSAGGGEEFMAQMTQFAMLEQIQNMAAESKVATAAAASSQANGLIGRTVSRIGADGRPVDAQVQSVVYDQGKPLLRIAGSDEPITMSDVLEVK